MARFPFIKMHGLGNDFVVIDTRSLDHFTLSEEDARHIACRRRGIGCDQIAILESSDVAGALCGARFMNADGSASAACGNATRCIALYLCEKEGTESVDIVLCGVLRTLRMKGVGITEACIGMPLTAAADIPLSQSFDTLHLANAIEAGPFSDGCATNVGNPHITFFVDDVDTCPLTDHGPALGHHTLLPERANIGAAQIISRSNIRLRVFERGAGETQACGTGACAAFSAARRRGLIDSSASIHMPGGSVTVSEDDTGALLLAGPARYVYSGVADTRGLAFSHE